MKYFALAIVFAALAFLAYRWTWTVHSMFDRTRRRNQQIALVTLLLMAAALAALVGFSDA